MPSSLCVHSDGTIGGGYAEAVIENYGFVPADIEMHEAEECLRCYQFFGGDPALTPQVAARRAWVARQRPRPHNLCPSCRIALPLSGICDNCSRH